MSEISIQLNGASRRITDGTSLRQLVESLKIDHSRIAVEVNNAIVSRSEHTSFLLGDCDVVEIVHAIGGG